MKLPDNKKIVLFDGVCNLCNHSIIYIIKRDYKDKFRFAPLQSEIGKTLLKEFQQSRYSLDSIVLYDPEKGLFSRSSAVLRISKELKFPSNLYSIFLIIPAFIRDWFYNYIAKNRYKWYGKQESCMIPTPELTKKFLN